MKLTLHGCLYPQFYLNKVGNHKTKVLQCRLISIDLLHVYKVPLEKFDFSKPNMVKLLNRIENSSV